MTNQEHLGILKQGGEAWNRWRKANPEIRLDLRRAYFSGANLSRADVWYIREAT